MSLVWERLGGGPMKVLVLGGYGFYGSRVAQTFERRGHEVHRGTRRRAGRSGEVVVNLLGEGGFDALEGFDAVVNCTDSVNAPPDRAIEAVLRRGGAGFEAGAEGGTVERLMSLPQDTEPARGAAILGVGIFPGWSTLFAAQVAGPQAQKVDVCIRFSPLSGAGRGNCALMAHSLFVPAVRYEGGQVVVSPTAVGPATDFDFEGQRRPAIGCALPDTHLVQQATNAAEVTTYFALEPSWLRWNFRLLAWVSKALKFLKPLLMVVLTWQLALVRAWLLRKTPSSVSILAIAERGSPQECRAGLHFEDGQQGTADGIVAAVEAWFAAPSQPTGLHRLSDVLTLEALKSTGLGADRVWGLQDPSGP